MKRKKCINFTSILIRSYTRCLLHSSSSSPARRTVVLHFKNTKTYDEKKKREKNRREILFGIFLRNEEAFEYEENNDE